MAVTPEMRDWMSRQRRMSGDPYESEPMPPMPMQPTSMPTPGAPPPVANPTAPAPQPGPPQAAPDMAAIAQQLEQRQPPPQQAAQPAQRPPEPGRDPGRYGRDMQDLEAAEGRLASAYDVDSTDKMLAVLQGAFEGGRDYSGPAWQGRQDRAQRDVEVARKRLQESQAQDPSSPQSQRMRSLIAPLAEAAGIDPSIVESMSAADFGEAKDVGSILTSLQQRQAQMEQRAQLELQKRQLKLQDRNEERQYKEGRFEEELGARSDAAMDRFKQQHPYRLQRAHAVAGNRADVMREMIHLRDQLEDQDRQEKYEEQATRPLTRTEFDGKVEKLGDKLQGSGVPAMQANLNELEKAMEEARRINGGQVFTMQDEAIRRAGPDEAIGLMSEPARRVMQTWQKVMNAQIKDEAGAAVAKQEMERQKVAFGRGIFWNEDDFIRGIENLRRASDAAVENYASAFGPEIWDEYNRRLQGFRAQKEGRGGQPQGQSPQRQVRPRPAPQRAPAQGGKVTVTNPETGESFRVDPGDVEAAQREGFQVAR
jgi:hypothetical protein